MTDEASADDVFINCPFDDEFTPIFRVLIFTIMACGFRPRSGREIDDGGQARIDKIYGLIQACRYGIHDISRAEVDIETGLARFNMPFELGLFLGAKRFGNKVQKSKRTLILDVEQHRYRIFLSDLAGMDICAHAGDRMRALQVTRDWLANVSRRQLPSANKLRQTLDNFETDLPQILTDLEFEISSLPHFEYESIVARWLLEAPSASAE